MSTPVITTRTSAPVRLDFAGGWTDVAPFTDHREGVVVNAAIALRTRVAVARDIQHFELHADALGQHVVAASSEVLRDDDQLPLLKAAVRRYRPPPCAIHVTADAPPGSGLGGSGALGVALVHALASTSLREKGLACLADEACALETVDAAIAGGKQDQYAAAFGGFNRLAFRGTTTTVEGLDLDPAFADDLARRLVLCHTGRSRFSGSTIQRVMKAYADGDPQIADALSSLASIASAMSEALVAADLPGVARLLSANWEQQQRLDPSMSTEPMRALEAGLLRAGALGGKAAGSGAGGSMFFVASNREAAVDAARRHGAVVLPVEWDVVGVRDDSESPAA